ncbi:MAG: SBBP repeat-containing protein, partial [Phycisphaerae bacterium]
MTLKSLFVGCILVVGRMAAPAVGQITDCNGNGIDDACDIAGGPIYELIDSNGEVPGNGLSAPRGITVDTLGNVFVTGFIS